MTMLIHVLLTGRDQTTSDILELKAKVRGALRSHGGIQLSVTYRKHVYTIMTPSSGGVYIWLTYTKGKRVLASQAVTLSILKKLCKEV